MQAFTLLIKLVARWESIAAIMRKPLQPVTGTTVPELVFESMDVHVVNVN